MMISPSPYTLTDKNGNNITRGALRHNGYTGPEPQSPQELFAAAKSVGIPVSDNAFESWTARESRVPVLKAFDIYKSNVAYGIETETPEQHQSIEEWYQSWLDLPEVVVAGQEVVFPVTPDSIAKYL
jgi:hypothetical protein